MEKSRDAFTHNITSLVFLATILNLHVIFAHWDESSKKLVLCIFEYGITPRTVLISANIVFDWCSGSFNGCGKKKKNWEFHILVSCSDFMKWISIGFVWIYIVYDVQDYCPRAVPDSAIIFTPSTFSVFGKNSIALQ